MNRPLKTRLWWLLLACLVISCLLAIRGESHPAIPAGLQFMPPHPEMLGSLLWINEAPPDLSARLSRGIDAPNYVQHLPSGDFNLLVVLVDFPDKTWIVAPEDFDELFFATLNSHSVADYYDEISYGSLSLEIVNLPSEIGWQRTPAQYPYSFYVNNDGNNRTSDDFGWGAYPQNLQGIVAHTLPLIDEEIDFSQYDNDRDGFVDGVVFVHAGGAAELSLSPGDIWSASWDMSSGNGPGPILTEDGVYVDDFVFGPEFLVEPGDGTIGVFTHELGHLLFGLPDLYDLDHTSYGVGTWSLMSYGAWNGEEEIFVPGVGWISVGDSPAWPDAWTRMRMGFDTPQLITQNVDLHTFTPVEDSAGSMVKMSSPKMGAHEYFLVEYRDQQGYDTYLPGSGLLVWHVDEAKWNRWELNQAECAGMPCCACESDHPLLALEQADGDLDLEALLNSGDTGDPFPGAEGNTAFDFESIPESGSYYASDCPLDSCIKVEDVISSTGMITANLNVVCQASGACVDIVADRMLGWGEAGEYALYEASLQNCGNADDTLTLASESTWLAQFFDLGSGEPFTSTQVELSAGGTLALGITVTVPSDALWSSADVLSLTVTSANDAGISATVQMTTTVPYCTLVVDDDRSAPDVEEAYINSLTAAGFDFDVWDTQAMGSPDEETLAAHKAVVWFTGTPISQTLTQQDELGLMSYLDGGGGFFFSSQEYLTDTLRNYFGRQYLQVSTFTDNAGVQVVSGVPGNPLSDSLGPYTMSITTSLSDQMTPLSSTLSAFTDEGGITNALSYDTGAWRAMFLGWPFEHLAQADGEELMATALNWLEVVPRPKVAFESAAREVCAGQAITFTNTSSNASSYLWSFGDGVTSTLTDTVHAYSDPLTATVTLTGTNCCGYALARENVRVYDTPQVEFTTTAELIYIYQPVTFSLLTTEPGELFYQWNFGDGTPESSDPMHTFTRSGWYTVTLTTRDDRCAGVTAIHIYVNSLMYLPLTLKEPNWKAMPPEQWQGSLSYPLVSVFTLALALVLPRRFKRR